jgi:hypothetical protein
LYKKLFAFLIRRPTHRPGRTESNLIQPGHQTYGGEIMTNPIQWESDITHALDMAKKEGKPVLLDFFNPG